MGPWQPNISASASMRQSACNYPKRPLSGRVALRAAAQAMASVLVLSGAAQARAEGEPSSTADAAQARLNVQIDGGKGNISIDGKEVARGKFRGELAPGRHELRVTLDGHDSVERALVLEAGEIRSESITLKPSVGTVAIDGSGGLPPALDGIYGGVHLLAAFEPRGSGTTLENACDSIGASSCSAGSVTGGGLIGFIGFMLAPLGVELALMGSGDLADPSASFDGVTGSEINPVVAAPSREEKFTIARFGGGAAVRVRVVKSVSRFRFSFAIGPGLAYRVFIMRRDTDAEGGRSGFYSDVGASYVSPLLSTELALDFKLGGSTAVSLGLASWFEHAGDDTTSRAEERSVLIADGNAPPLPHATPEYDLANGPQWFLGPFLGLAFGP